MKFSLVNIQKEEFGGYYGITMQNLIGEIESVKMVADRVHDLNGRKIKVGVFPEMERTPGVVQFFSDKPFYLLDKME